jgi:hypothetical protein
MLKTALLMIGLISMVPATQASEIMDWLDDHAAGIKTLSEHAPVAADSASLLTLENKQTEMYPQPSPNGRYFLTVTWKGKDAWISRRFSENGDPANRVTFDDRALDSIHWKNNDKVYYLSGRAGGLGLWEKISDGEGMQRRIQRLSGSITEPILLADDSIIATRFKPISRRTKSSGTRKHDNFNNWTSPGYTSEIVRYTKAGDVRMLAQGVNSSLSPDGQWIAFAMPTGRSIHLFRMRIDGSDLIQVTDARSVDVQPSWSRDGKSILFTSNRINNNLRHPKKSGWDIWSIGIDGRNLIQVTFDKANDGGARMGSDGRIYFHSDRPISKVLRTEHQVKSAPSHGYHIWTIKAPK